MPLLVCTPHNILKQSSGHVECNFLQLINKFIIFTTYELEVFFIISDKFVEIIYLVLKAQTIHLNKNFKKKLTEFI